MRNISHINQVPVTLADLKDYLRIDFSDDDNQLTRCLIAGCNHIETETDRDIVSRQYIETFPYWQNSFTLKRSPLISLFKFCYFDEDNEEAPFTDFTVKGVYSLPKVVIHEKPQTYDRHDAIQISYTAGEPNNPLVNQAILWSASLFYMNREPEIVGTNTSTLKLGLERLIMKLKAGGYQ